MDERCNQCRFWRPNDIQNKLFPHPDDHIGECRRCPPLPPLNLYDIRNMLAGLAAKIGADEETWREWETGVADTHTALWPSTSAVEWCGEFQTKN